MHPNHLLEKLNVISPQESFARLCVHNDINAGGIFFSRDFINHFGPFDENYRLLEDWPMWLKIFSQKARITYSPFNAIKYRSNVGFATSTNALYMEDKRRVLETIIIPQKKEIGLNYYWKARVSFWIRSSIFVRKIYGLLVRKGR